MPRTRSAAKQARASLRRQSRNKSIKSRLRTLESKFLASIAAKKAAEASETFRALTAAFDKAAKVQVVHPNTASRKKSRLAARLKSITTAAA
jgi:small subunit ribosomal protein S20